MKDVAHRTHARMEVCAFKMLPVTLARARVDSLALIAKQRLIHVHPFRAKMVGLVLATGPTMCVRVPLGYLACSAR